MLNSTQTDAPIRQLKGGWFEQRSPERYVLSRRWPPQFDVSASASFPVLRRGRLAQHIRQDVWRAFKSLRGFAPVVEIGCTNSGLFVKTGGQVAGSVPNGTNAAVQRLLDDPASRARWINWAKRRAT